MIRKTNKGKKFPTSRVNALRSGAYACDVYSTRVYLTKLSAVLRQLEAAPATELATPATAPTI